MIAATVRDGGLFDIVEQETPRPGEGEVTLEVRACGICGSDLHMTASGRFPVGTTIGHEASGVVTEVGPGAEGVEVGDRVCVFPFHPCGRCAWCEAGHPNLCESMLPGFGLGARPGGYAQFSVAHHSMLWKLPEDLGFEAGAFVEPVAVAVHGVNLVEAQAGQRAVVVGAGPIGLLVALVLKARGVPDCVVVERNPARRAQAERLGLATASGEDGAAAVRERLGGPAHVAFECAGAPAALALALDSVGPRGRVALLGIGGAELTFPQMALMGFERMLIGSRAYDRDDWRTALELVHEGRIPVGELITNAVPLAEVNDAFLDLRRPETDQTKVLLLPSQG